MKRTLAVAGSTVALALAAAPAAMADHANENLPWPSRLPPQSVSDKVQPPRLHSCPRPKLACVDRVVRLMNSRWKSLNRRCDHRAVFALTYLRTTQGFRHTLARDRDFFSDLRWIVTEDAIFADYYFRAYDAYTARRSPPLAWQIAFDAATGKRTAKGNTNGGQDIFLGMNAHIQRDLPFVLARVGLRKRRGPSRKPDHDKVNEILTRVLDPIEDELGARYDPIFTTVDLKPSPLDELGALEVMKSWREGAWRNAERLLNAKTPADRRQVSDSIETTSRLWAQAIDGGELPGYGASRDAYCRAHLH
jgi:uncharacterized protein DUF5995